MLGLTVLLISVASSAQIRPTDRFRSQRMESGFNRGQLTRCEKLELRKDQIRYQMSRRRATKDGIVTPMERRRLSKMRRNDRRELFYFSHNNRRRII
jgi:hypothetical protein